MSAPTPALPPEPRTDEHLSGEHPCTPGDHCPSNPAVAKKGFVFYALGKERLKTLALIGTAVGVSVGAAYALARDAKADAADGVAAQAQRQMEDRAEVLHRLDSVDSRLERLDAKLERYFGPMVPVPMVREPRQ